MNTYNNYGGGSYSNPWAGAHLQRDNVRVFGTGYGISHQGMSDEWESNNLYTSPPFLVKICSSALFRDHCSHRDRRFLRTNHYV